MSTGFRNFFITFLLTLILFGVIAYQAFGTIIDYIQLTPDESSTPAESGAGDTSSGDNSNNGNTSTPPQPTEEGMFTALVLGEDLNGEIDSIILLRVNKAKNSYLISTIPCDTQIEADGRDVMLKELIKTRDVHFFKEKITALTGLAIDFYALMDIQGMMNIVDLLGNITYTIPYDMYYEDPEQDLVIDLKRGRQKLTSDIVMQLVRFKPETDDGSGEAKRNELQRDLLQSIFLQTISIENISKAPQVFESALRYCETDFTLDAFNENIDLIFSYAGSAKSDVAYPGSYRTTGGKTYFVPDVDKAITQYREFR